MALFERVMTVGVRRDKVGLWMIGAAGSVASTVALGVVALRKGLAGPTGLISALPPFQSAGLVDPGSLVIGGHEIRSESIVDAVRASHERARLFDEKVIARCVPGLRAIQRNLRYGTLDGSSAMIRKMADRTGPARDRCPAEVIERLSADIRDFQRHHRLDHVVVVNLASSEPPARRHAAHSGYRRLQKALGKPGSRVLPSSSLYALAALEAGSAFVNFTPSPGISVPAVLERAEGLGVPYMGNDGKTGETLVKSVLAPLFAMRNLNVLSWVGQNILGNRDGAVLKDPRTRLSKIQSKDKVVSQIVKSSPSTHVSIEYVPSLDDWKVAWDFIHFEGFLGTRMAMQFTWQGSDSALAAPLVIDLARLAAFEQRAGRGGAMRHLACFFKDPIQVEEHDYFTQWQQLVKHVKRHGGAH